MKVSEVPQVFAQGLALHQQGKLAEAAALYRRILAVQPRHFDAMQLLGAIAIQTQDYPHAVELLTKALKINPGHASSHNNRGNALKELGQLAEAVASYDRAIAIKADFAEAHNNRGMALQALGRLTEAVASYDRALAIRADFAEAYNYRGIALKGLGQLDAAIASYDRAIALRGNYAEAWNNRGVTLKALKRLDDAIASYNHALNIVPDYVIAHCNRGVALQEAGKLDAAIADFDRAIALQPGYADAWYNRGIALKELGQLDAAIASDDQAIALRPDYAEAYCNRGIALQGLMQLDAALASYQRSIALMPDYAPAHWNLGFCDLLCGNFSRGWQGYEWRWKKDESSIEENRQFTQPLWLGKESLAGRTILLYAEQGLGDTLQFCRYARRVADLGARVILEVQPALVELLRSLEGVSQLVARGDALPSFDCQCPLLSLPLAFGTEPGTIPIPSSPRYLQSDPHKVAAWQERLGAKTRRRVGIVWSGNPAHDNDRNRSIALDTLALLLTVDCEFFSLQKEIRDSDREALVRLPQLRHLGEELHDFTDTAALCELMDIVISVDTSVAHLAGAMGKPVWVLLPFSPDWRWLTERADSPWYPGARLYRQKKTGDWTDVMAQVRNDLLTSGAR